MKGDKEDAKKSGTPQSGGDGSGLGTRFLEVLIGAGLLLTSALFITGAPATVVGLVGLGLTVDGIRRGGEGGEEGEKSTQTRKLVPPKKENGGSIVKLTQEKKGKKQAEKKEVKKEQETNEEEKDGEVTKEKSCAITWTCQNTVFYNPNGFEAGEEPFVATTTMSDAIVVFMVDDQILVPGQKRIVLSASESPYKVKACLRSTKDNSVLKDFLIRNILIKTQRVKIEWEPTTILELSEEKLTVPDEICNATTTPPFIKLVYEWDAVPDLTPQLSNQKSKKPKLWKITARPFDQINYCGQKTNSFTVIQAIKRLSEKEKIDLRETDEKYLFTDKENVIHKIRASWVGFSPLDPEIFQHYEDEKTIGGILPMGRVQNICSQMEKAGGHYTYLKCKLPMFHTSTGKEGRGSVTAWTVLIGKTIRVVGIGCHVSGGSAIYMAYFPNATGTKLFDKCSLDLDIEDEAKKPPVD